MISDTGIESINASSAAIANDFKITKAKKTNVDTGNQKEANTSTIVISEDNQSEANTSTIGISADLLKVTGKHSGIVSVDSLLEMQEKRRERTKKLIFSRPAKPAVDIPKRYVDAN